MSTVQNSGQSPLKVSYQEDPRVAEEQRDTEYSGHIVPPGARVNRGALALSASSLISGLVWLFYGALVASLVGTHEALIGMLVSLAAFIVINWPLAKWGTRHGLDATLMSRRVFGYSGAALISLLTAANVTYYAVFESSVVASAMKSYLGGPDLRIWYLIVVAAMLPLMRGSVQTWMGKLNGILLPLFLAGLVASVVVTGVNSGWNMNWTSTKGVIPPQVLGIPGWLFAFVLYMGTWLQMPLTLDFSRFGRPQDLGFHRGVSFGFVFFSFSYFINGVVGIFLVQASGLDVAVNEAGVVSAILKALGIWGLLFVLVTQVRINTLNYYLASMHWQRLAKRYLRLDFSRLTWVLLTGVVVFGLMLTDVFGYLQRALMWQGVFIVSWVGIVMTHLILTREDRENGPEFRPGRLPSVSAGLAAWLAASVIGIVIAENKAAFPVASNLAPLITLVASVVLYLLVRRQVLKSVLDRVDDPRDAVKDPWGAYIACHVCDRSYLVMEMDSDPSAGGAGICAACAMNHGAFRLACLPQASGATVVSDVQ